MISGFELAVETIVTRDEPEVPAETCALYDNLELVKLTAAVLSEPALTVLVKFRNNPTVSREDKIVKNKNDLEYLNIAERVTTSHP